MRSAAWGAASCSPPSPICWPRCSRVSSTGRWRCARSTPGASPTWTSSRAFFTPANEERPEIHGGFALAHFSDGPETEEILKELKVSIRCLPFDAPDEEGTCLFTGRPTRTQGVFAKAY